MPAWMFADGAWIAFAVTLITIVAAIVMHRVILKVLRAPPPESSEESENH